MLVSIKDKEGKSLFTHTSLLEEDKVEKIQQVYRREKKWATAGSFLTLYGLLEAVNRIPFLAKQRLEYRVAGVALPLVLAHQWLIPKMYWTTTGNAQLRTLCIGAPVFEKADEVPELDKMFFFLDDDNNYEPSLWHHGV